MQNRVKSHPATAPSSSSSGGDGSGSGFCLSDIMELDAGSGGDHTAPGSPRSKHSASEQKRRSKINERFQILSDLVPQSDQKRDRATFLLEVIEYVKFLQEKVQKHETCTGGDWSQENAKLVPWSSNRVPVDLMPGAAPTTENCSPVNFLDNSIPTMLEMLQNTETIVEPARLNAAYLMLWLMQWKIWALICHEQASPCKSIWVEEQFPEGLIICPVQRSRRACQQAKLCKLLGRQEAVSNLSKC